jgi:hypothetical protein
MKELGILEVNLKEERIRIRMEGDKFPMEGWDILNKTITVSEFLFVCAYFKFKNKRISKATIINDFVEAKSLMANMEEVGIILTLDMDRVEKIKANSYDKAQKV